MEHRPATDHDLDLLAQWNHQLICDEGHRNQMAMPELRERMRTWLSGEYEAVIFLVDGEPAAYALYRDEGEDVYLRQLFVASDRRRQGIGREAVETLRSQVWPAARRLTVDVLTANTAGLSFWRAVGYRDYCLTLEVIPQKDELAQPHAADLFRQGCACSQAILAVYGQPLGLSRDLAMRLAAGFAGGMRMGETCGAVTGALMVLGLRHASVDCETPAGRKTVYDRTVEFVDRFKSRNGSVVCRELLGCDISAPEGMRQAEQQNLFKTICVKMVQDAAAILENMAESQPAPARDA
jgi:C_GCAxxG_C_C family probable redox protein